MMNAVVECLPLMLGGASPAFFQVSLAIMQKPLTLQMVMDAFVLLCLFFQGCGRPVIHPSLMLADSLMDTAPDSALRILQRMDTVNFQDRSEVAHYALLLSKARNKCLQSLAPCDSLLEIALDYYDDVSPARVTALLYCGRLEQELGNDEQAVQLLQEALEMVKRYPDEIELHRHILNTLSDLYFCSENFEEAFQLAKDLYQYCLEDVDKSIALGQMASYYFMKEESDSALALQRRSIQHAFASKDSLAIVSSLMAQGINFDGECMDSAVHYVRMALQYVPLNRTKGDCHYILGNMLLRKDKDSSEVALHHLNICLNDTTYPHRLTALYDIATAEERMGNIQKANACLRQYVDYLDSLAYPSHTDAIKRVIHNYDVKMKIRNEQLRNERKLWKVAGGGGVLVFVMVLLFQYKFGKKKKEQQKTDWLLAQAMAKIPELQDVIANNQTIVALLQKEKEKLTEENVQVKDLIKDREANLERLFSERNSLQHWIIVHSSVYKKIELLSRQRTTKENRKVLNVAEQDSLRNLVFHICAEEVKDWQERFPRLSEGDLLLLCLQKMNFDRKTIAICFGYGDTHAINQRIFRIKERMKVD